MGAREARDGAAAAAAAGAGAKAKVGIAGAGSWGTALALLLDRNGHDVRVWSIDGAEIAMLREKREHVLKLPGVRVPESVGFTTGLAEAVAGMDLVVMAVPSPFTRATARLMRPHVAPGQVLVDAAKGIEEGTLLTLSAQIEQEIPQADVAVLSGPSHAEEVGRGMPTAVVAGARTEKTARFVQGVFMGPDFRVYVSRDRLGMELGGALKNVIALAAGMADGLGYGDNTKAALITRGIAEVARLGEAAGGARESFMGLAGIGDLIVTCASQHSRNRRAGFLIGQGMGAAEAMAEVRMVVEGVNSAKAAIALGKRHGVALPIIEAVNRVLFEGRPPAEEVAGLMGRAGKAEHEDLAW
jgi:glycerol-3-phosphate dehydrogenase (NAD(P)+)